VKGLQKINEENEYQVYKKNEIKNLRNEMEKLLKKKVYYEKQLKQKLDNQNKAVNSLKNALKQKDEEIKTGQKKMKEKITLLQKEN